METKFPSPNGKYIFQISPWEARMSLWIESPSLVNASSNETLLSFSDPNWSLDLAEWMDEEHVKMQLRHYPGDHSPSSFKVGVDCLTGQATIGDDTFDLKSLEEHLEALYRRGQMGARSTARVRLGCLTRLLRQLRGG